MIDLQAYLERIDVPREINAGLESLQQIAFAHACSIPFENLDAFCHRPVSLDLQQIQSKLVSQRRGGYCFEQHALLAAVLTRIGFSVQQLSGRVWYNTPLGVTPPRTHVFLAVEVEGQRWLVDCGVGGSAPQGIMKLDLSGRSQTVGRESRRLVAIENRLIPTYMHQVQYGREWMNIYEFTGESMPQIDQEMGNWWVSTHPNSKFRKNLIVASLSPDGSRFNLLNREFLHRRGATIVERMTIQSEEQLGILLRTRFDLHFKDVSEVFDRLKRNEATF